MFTRFKLFLIIGFSSIVFKPQGSLVFAHHVKWLGAVSLGKLNMKFAVPKWRNWTKKKSEFNNLLKCQDRLKTYKQAVQMWFHYSHHCNFIPFTTYYFTCYEKKIMNSFVSLDLLFQKGNLKMLCEKAFLIFIPDFFFFKIIKHVFLFSFKLFASSRTISLRQKGIFSQKSKHTLYDKWMPHFFLEYIENSGRMYYTILQLQYSNYSHSSSAINIGRQGNAVAHALAQRARLSCPLDVWMESVPPDISTFVQSDLRVYF